MLIVWYDKLMSLSKLSMLVLCAYVSITVSCARKPTLASIDANLSVTDDTSGSASARARVAFTEYTSTMSSDTLTVTFSDGGGNIMTFVLKGSGGKITSKQYDVDGTNNGFQAQLIITRNLQPETVSITGNGGYINVTSATIDDNQVSNFSGDFLVNFQAGGAGQGTFNTGS